MLYLLAYQVHIIHCFHSVHLKIAEFMYIDFTYIDILLDLKQILFLKVVKNNIWS